MAVCSYYAAAAGDTTLDATRLWVFDLSSNNNTWLEEVSVKMLEQRTGPIPATAVLELDLGLITRETAGVSDNFERRIEDAFDATNRTIFNRYLEHDILICYYANSDIDAEDFHFYPVWMGTIVAVAPNLQPNAETVELLAQDWRWKMGSAPLFGQYADVAGSIGRIHTRTVMNPHGQGNHIATTIGNDVYHLFGPHEAITAANAWTPSRALSYLIYFSQQYSGADMFASSEAVLDDAADIVLPQVSLEGLRLPQALEAVLRPAGVCWWMEAPWHPFKNIHDETFLPMLVTQELQAGAEKVMRLPAASAAASADTNTSWLQGMRLTAGIADSYNEVTVAGAHIEAEAEWVLAEDWDASDQTAVDADTDFGNRSATNYQVQYDPVYRHWVLDEDGKLGGTGTSQCTTVFGTDTYVRRRRKFEKPYRTPEEPRRPYMIKIKIGSTWYGVDSSGARFDTDRAGLTFEYNSIDKASDKDAVGYVTDPDDVTQTSTAALNTIVGVKITAIIRRDDRLLGEADQGTDAAADRVLAATVYDDGYRYVYRDSTSEFASGSDETLLDMEAQADAYAAKLRDGAENASFSASFVIPWIHMGFRMNDRIVSIDEPPDVGVAGRDISLQTNRGDDAAYPRIVRIAWDFEAGQTVINTTDDREAHF